MPQTTHTKHPRDPITITFTEADHKYVDSNGQVYKSASALIHDSFPPFDAPSAATRIAEREGRTQEEVLEEWKEKTEKACAFGTRCHELAEYVLMGGRSGAAHFPSDEKEELAYRCVRNAVRMLQERFKLISCEIVLFSPANGISGTCDLLMRGKDGRYLLLDYKTNENLNKHHYNMGYEPFEDLKDNPMGHYSLQLSIYEYMLRHEGHVESDAVIDRAIIYIPPFNEMPEWIPLPLISQAASLFNQTN